jgi:hypothetical protein
MIRSGGFAVKSDGKMDSDPGPGLRIVGRAIKRRS